MFEKLLQKILKDVIGQFTQQIDVNNLSVGIWSGQIQINKVKLNKNLFKKLGIPISIIYSYISQLKIKIPWKSFFSSPLTINIQSAFALCQFDQNQMSLQQKKKTLINSLKILISTITNKIIQKSKKQQTQQTGYLQNVFLKMFDNLYLNVKNIHFRFQNQEKNFSFGLSIKSIDIHAVDQNNNLIFIDRSKMKENQKTIKRLFDISKLQLYWDYKQVQFLSKILLKEKKQSLTKQIEKKITQINSPTRLNIFYLNLQGFILQTNHPKASSYTIQIIQQKIQINLKKQIVQQFLYFIKNLQQIQLKNNQKIITECSVEGLRFLKLYCQEYFNENKASDGKIKDQKLAKIMIQHHNLIKQLLNLDKTSLANSIQAIILNDIGKQRIIKSVGLKQDDFEIGLKNPQLKKQLNLQINFNLKLPKLLVYLFSLQNKLLFELNLTNSIIEYKSKNNTSSELEFKVGSIVCLGKQNNLIFGLKEELQNSTAVKFNYLVKSQISQIQVCFSKINVVYDPNVINSVKDFFILDYFDQKLKNKTLDKLDNLEESVSKKINMTKSQTSIKVKFQGIFTKFIATSTQFYLNCYSIQANVDLSSKCQLLVKDIGFSLSQKNYDNSILNIINPFNISIQYNFLHKKLQLDIQRIAIKISKQIYLSLPELPKIFSGQQKNQMMKKASIIGQIFVKQNRWKKTLSMLYQGKIYLYNPNQQYPKFVLRIRKAKQIIKGKLIYLIISDKKKQIQIAFKTQKQNQIWKSQLQKIVQFRRDSQQRNSQQFQLVSSDMKVQQQKQDIQILFKLQRISLEIVFNKSYKIEIACQEIKYFAQKIIQNEQNVQISKIQCHKCIIKFNQDLIFQNKNMLYQPFFNGEIKKYDQNNKIVMLSEINLNSFSFNFDPVMIILLSSFLQKDHQTQNIQLYINKTEQKLDKQDQNKILFLIKINLNKANIYFKNKKSKLNIVSLQVQKSTIQINVKYYEFSIKGCAENLKLLDQTRYPNTIYKKDMIKDGEKQKTQILSFKNNRNSITFDFQNVEKGSSKYSDKKNQLLKIQFNQFKLNYIHQMFFRAVDYLFVQLIGSILSPSFFQQFSSRQNIQTQNINPNKTNLSQSQAKLQFSKFTKKQDELIRTKSMSKLTKKKLQEIILTGKPLYLQLIFINSVINLVTENINENISLDISKIIVVNDSNLKIKEQQGEMYSLYTPHYKIQMNQISISITDTIKNPLTTYPQKSLHKNILNQHPINLNIQIQMFNKDLQYIFIYGQRDIFKSNMIVNVQLQPCHLLFKSQNLISLQKLLVFNLLHNDGLEFLMIYDYVDFSPEMKINMKLFSESFCLQMIHQQEKIIIDAGNFHLNVLKSQTMNQTHLQCQFLVINYENQQKHQELLTSRKSFGKFQVRKTFFRSFLKSAQFQKQNKQSIFTLQISENKIDKHKTIICSMEQVLVIFNEKAILLFKKIFSNRQKLIPRQKVYKEQNSKTQKQIQLTNSGQKVIITSPLQTSIKFLANNVIFCCRFKQSKNAILAFLLSCRFKIKHNEKSIQFPNIQGFIANQKQIANQNLLSIKKRTILRPTSVKYLEDGVKRVLQVKRLFFKISVTDIKQILSIQKQFNEKLIQTSKHQEKLNQNKKSVSSSLSVSIQSGGYNDKIIQQKDSNTQHHQKSNQLKFETFQLMIINDTQSSLTPLIYGKFQLQYQKTFQIFNSELKLDFFNIRNSYWQPLIQNFNIQIITTPHLKIKTTSKQLINVNLSTNFIENLYKTMLYKQTGNIRLYQQEEIGVDQINSWVVLNHMGETLTFKSIDRVNQVVLSANQSTKLAFLNSYQENFSQNKVQDKQICLHLVMGDKLQIKQLNINEFGLKKINFIYKQKKCSLLKKLYVDISKNVKYLTFSSVLQVENKTDLTFKFYLSQQSKSLYVQPKSSQSIPFNLNTNDVILQNVFLQFQLRQPSLYYSQNIQNNSTISNEITLQQIQKMSKLFYKSMSFRIKVRYEKMKKIISFQPLYIIKNYLPQQLTIVLKNKTQKNMLNQYFIQSINSSNQHNFKSIYHEIVQTEISFYIEGYQWTDFQEFQNKKKIELKDYQNKVLEIRIFRLELFEMTSEIVIYYPLLIKNKSIQAIKIQTKSSKRQTHRELMPDESDVLVSRDVVFEVDGKCSQEVYLKNYKQFFMYKNKVNNLKSFSKYFIYKNISKIKENLTITQFKIYNKYLINNLTENDILLRPQNGKTGQIQTVKKGQITNLLFFQVDSNISITSLYLFCPKQSQFQWSHSLNLTYVKQTTFFIRSRYQFNKMKHYFLEVTNRFQNCLEIVFKEISKEQEIPFLLVNNCENKRIYVKNTLQQILPNKQVLFNWDNPFHNSNLIYIQIKGPNKLKKPYTLDVSRKQNIIISSKQFDKNMEIQIIIQPNRKKIIFFDQLQASSQKQVQIKKIQLQLPLRISLINNSITPAMHVLDFSTYLKLQQIQVAQNNIFKAQLNLIQIDNQVLYNCLYPVILSTSMNLVFQNTKNKSLTIQFKEINLKLEEDFFQPILEIKKFMERLLVYQNQSGGTKVLEKNKRNKNENFFISKLVLPRIVINLQVQTKNFSIQTTFTLEKPQIGTFPFKEFPYPIKKVALNILSHLSISPWAFITSFKKGIQILMTEQSAGRAFQGFFGTILGALSNTLTGILGFIVGYDVQRVDNLIDGIDQGFNILFKEIRQIPEYQTTSCNLASILQGTGKTIINLVFKPIKGVLRMTLKITQGVKKTALFSFDQTDKVKTRLPIVFYNRQQYFLSYNQQQSRSLKALKQITGNKLQYFYLVKFFKIQLLIDKIQLLLVIGTQSIVLLNLTKRKINWIIDMSKIKKIQIVDICKLRILVSDQYQNTKRLSKKDSFVVSDSGKYAEYEIFMINQQEAKQFVENYVKVKKLSKIQF